MTSSIETSLRDGDETPVDAIGAFDVREIPFSTRGSWLDLSPVVALHSAADEVHLVSHVNGMHPVFELRPERDGQRITARWSADPAVLRWTAEDGAVVEATFDGPRAVRFRGRGLELRLTEARGELTPFTGGYLFQDPVDEAFVLTSYETGRRYRIRMLAGPANAVGIESLGRVERTVLLGAPGEYWEAEVIESTTGVERPTTYGDFDAILNDNRTAFVRFADAVAPWRDESTPAALLAAYTLWSATVAPEGMITREAVLMSKHWMDKVWSWDHCFNALALAPGLPELALDQFLLPFDHQDSSGALPDSVTHSEALFNYVKPPIHGWAFRKLRASLPRPLDESELESVYAHLARWTEYWLNCRRAPGRTLPYYQHGNDSGWDNASTFDSDRVIESADLAAFLIVQLDVLVDLGAELGHSVDRWVDARDELMAAMLEQLWTPDGFAAVGTISGTRSTSTSLLGLLPLVLGDRLPTGIRDAMADQIRAHLTEFGLATELPASPRYEADGYWRGPIWAPSTALIEDGLRASGYATLADEVSRRFRALCERSGFAENFDALTGEGLRDRAYTWTASVYLTLSAAYVRRAAPGRVT